MAAIGGCGSDTVAFPGDAGGGAAGAGDMGGNGGQGATGANGGMGGMGGTVIPPGCGDGAIGDGEGCDGADLGGQDCTSQGFSDPAGLSCADDCQLDASGCQTTCDGQLLETGEDCDGTDFAIDCTSAGYSNPLGGACVACTFDASGCSASCDGALLEPGEECDGSDLGGVDCTTLGYVNATGMACSNDCALDAGGCSAVCGNGTSEPGEQCDDSNTTAGDGCNSSCQFEGTTCGNAIPVALGLGSQTFAGTTVGGGQHQTTQCSGEATTPDRTFAVTVGATGFLTAHLPRPTTSYDSILYALTNCLDPSSGVWCADQFANATPNGAEVISFAVTAGSTYTIVVDGWNGATGDFELVLDLSAGTCADPVPFPLWSGGSSLSALGTTVGKPNNTSSSCGGAGGSDVIYQITPMYSGNVELRIPAPNGFPAILAAQTGCNDIATEIACDADPIVNNPEVINVSGTNGVPFFGTVDSSPISISNGSYRLQLSPP
jgi:cysteine-rich repeat protein